MIAHPVRFCEVRNAAETAQVGFIERTVRPNREVNAMKDDRKSGGKIGGLLLSDSRSIDVLIRDQLQEVYLLRRRQDFLSYFAAKSKSGS
jgi:hypothetical protein